MSEEERIEQIATKAVDRLNAIREAQEGAKASSVTVWYPDLLAISQIIQTIIGQS
jgi:hypothetical protein